METSITLPGIKIERVIYHGINTIVYAGKREGDDKSVVVKTAADEYPRPRDIARLRREYELARELNLAGIVKPLALEKYGNGIALVLEDFGGTALSAVLREGGMPLDEFLDFAVNMIAVLGDIHANNVIHKDLKPANIILDRSAGILKITDFGIASILSREEQNLRSPGALEGTLAYMSPEQTGRMNRSIDYRSDFYSLGATFYEMLTGSPPFASKDPMELVHCHIARNPPPPETKRPDVPPAVSAVVMKLLAKTAEDRYQSSFGLRSDLETCRRLLRETGEARTFELGTLDRSEQFRIRQKLYGREDEIAVLLSSFRRVCEGDSRLMLVAGYSGIGKSALVGEVQRPVVENRAYFISGKFDQFKRDIPYSAVIQAFQELARQLLTEEPERIEGWKERLLEAVGSNGGVITDVIPEIELIIGEQPPVPPLGPTESQNRFNLVFRNFVGAFARKEHPLVIFLDDLQWADAASLKLIHLLMTDQDTGHLLMLGAYRDNEVDASHPMMLMLDELRKSGRESESIFLKPLHERHVRRLTCEALSRDEQEVQSLANLTMEKTGGNPFFVTEFLKELYKKNLLNPDPRTGRWTWDTERIESMDITDNVVHLLSGKIMELSEATREVLKLASCVGSRFDLRTLAMVNEKTPDETANDLRDALVEGLIVPLADEYKYVGSRGGKAGQVRRAEFQVAYRFLHDRVQQAAYSLIPDEDKSKTHLAIGRHILAGTSAEGMDDAIFDIVNHMNIGAELIADEDERLEAARLNKRAGSKARQSTAYEPASRYFGAGIDLLGASGWEREYELNMELHLARADVETLRAAYESSEELVETILEKGRDVLDRTRGYEVRLRTLNAQNQLRASIDTARRVLRTLGVRLPEKAKQHHVLMHMLRTKTVIAMKGENSLLKAPDMKDPRKAAAMRILNAIGSIAYLSDSNLFAVILFIMTRLSYLHGIAPTTPFGISLFALAHAGVLHQFHKGDDFGRLALKLLDNPRTAVVQTKTVFCYSCFTSHWVHPVEDTFEGLTESARLGLESGDLEYYGYSVQVRILNKLYSKPGLDVVLEEAHRTYADVSKYYGQGMPYYILKVWCQMAECLADQAPRDTEFRGTFFDPDELLPMFERTNYRTATIAYEMSQAVVLSFLGEYEKSLGHMERAFAGQEGVMSLVLVPVFYCHYSMVLSSLHDEASRSAKRKYLKQIRRNQKQLLKWRDAAPMNQSQRYALVEAELARVQGKHGRAMKLYAEAIALARENGFTQDEALANERAGIFYEKMGQDRAARGHMREAYYLYEKWGARAKLRRLREEFEFLNRGVGNRSAGGTLSPGASITATETASTTSGGSMLDMANVVKALRSISGELRLDPLLDRLMSNILENAGAGRGVLFLEEGGELKAVARKTAEAETLRGESSLDECEDVPRSLIRDVLRGRENLVLADAMREEKFAGDPHIARTRPRSILCAPIAHGGRDIGLIYLENNLITGAFTPERLEIIRILGEQAAVSLENARLYSGLEDKVKEVSTSPAPMATPRETDNEKEQGGIARRLRTRVEHLALETGKQAELEIRGEFPDAALVNKLGEALTHMVSNAIIHGIESPVERKRAGKPETGRVHVRFAERDGRITIECEDDGAGLNGARIRARALRKHLITAEQARSMKEGELHRLLFMWGFSTAERRADFSGRGTGLAIVREDMRALGGRIIMKSKPGAYTRFVMELPANQA